MRNRNTQRGYAFLIVAIAVFVVAMLGITVLADFSIKSAQRKTDSSRLVQIYRAIVGDPSADTFGYLGDVGDYPTTFQDLVQSGGSTGWNGPYLTESLFSGSTIYDSFGSPLEYYLKLVVGSPDELAIISRGPDHSSSNSAANPNNRTQFTAPFPSSGAAYTSAAGNADNIAYPDFSVSPATAVDYQTTGTLAYNIVNKDVNQANAVVGACPDLYNIVATSRSRGSADTITLPYSPGLMDAFLQGLYDVSITSAKAMSAYFAESVSVYSGRTLTHALRGEDIDSTQMPSFTLTVYNESTGTFAHTLNVRYFTVGGIALGAVTTGTPKRAFAANACALIVVENGGVVYDQFVVPYGNYTRYVQNPAAGSPQAPYTLTVTNGGTQTNQLIVAQANGLVLGTVYKRKSQTFSVPSNPLPNPPIPAESAGTPVNFFKQDGVTVLSSQTLTANTTVTIP
jgi:hypothetical protein